MTDSDSDSSHYIMLRLASVRVLSLDVTGTILVHRESIMKTYAESAVWARFPNPPSESELKPAFKQVATPSDDRKEPPWCLAGVLRGLSLIHI